MGMSAWGLIAAPLMAQAPAPAAPTMPTPSYAVEASSSADVFGGLSAMDEAAMSEASGGADTAFSIGMVGINVAENNGEVADVSVNNSTTGQINDIAVQGNQGITTMFNNTGNGVVFQSTVNVNIFTDALANGQ